MRVMDEVTHVLKEGLVDGPTLYVTQKLVSAVDSAGYNVLPAAIPQEVRTPVVGLLLATVPLLISRGKIAEKISEYTMANAVAQTLALAGNGGTGGPGVIDRALDGLFDKVAALGAKPAGATAGYMTTTRGYVGSRATGAPARQPLRGLTTEHR